MTPNLHRLSTLLVYAVTGMGGRHVVIRQIDGPEIPAMDGSAAPFLDLIAAAGTAEQTTGRRAAIGSVPDAAMIVKGLAGTSVVAHGITPMSFWDAM